MKNFVGIVLIVCGLILGLFTFGCDSKPQLNENVIYFFTKPGCPYCDKASDYIKQMHPELAVIYKNVKENSAKELMLECAKKFKLPTNQLGTPLICMGNNYILGWSDHSASLFERALKTMK